MDSEVQSCTKCNKEYPIEHFKKKGSGRNTRCASCVAEYFQAYYHNNPERKQKQIARTTANKKKKTEENRILVLSAFASGCTDCGNMDLRVLEFDHQYDKVGNIARMMGFSTEKVKAEIDKCEVVCANCHRIRTAKQFNTWRNLLMPYDPAG